MDTQEQAIEIKKKGEWDDAIRTIIIAILIAVVFRSLLFEPFHIPSGSMKNNLLVGDYLFVSKYSYGYSRYSFPLGLPLFEGRTGTDERPKRGDVVVFRLPRNPKVDFIKRVIGLPGDRIQVRSSILYINGAPLKRVPAGTFTDIDEEGHFKAIPKFTETLPEGKEIGILLERGTGFANNTQEYTVPPNHYFMMGDNRDNSRDSRFENEVGYVPEENIVGRAEMIFFSTDGTADWWQVWRWVPSLRFDRFFKAIH